MNKKFLHKTRGAFLGLAALAAGLATPSIAGDYDDWLIYFDTHGGSIRAYGSASSCESQTSGECMIIMDDCHDRGEIVISSSEFDTLYDILAAGATMYVRAWDSMDPDSPLCSTSL